MVQPVSNLTSYGYSGGSTITSSMPSFGSLQGTSFGGASTGFDFTSMLNNGGSVEGIAKTGLGFATGGVSTAVDTVLKSIVGLDVFGELSKVTEYGLSSWGASQTPDTQTRIFQEEVIPYIKQITTNINVNNVQDVVNELEKYLMFIIKIQEHKLRDHTKAGSTKAARKLAISMAQDLRAKIIDPIITNLKENGVKVVVTQKFTTDSDHAYTYADPNSFHNDKGYYHNLYSFVMPAVNSSNYNGVKDIVSDSTDDIYDQISDDDISVQTAGMGVFGIAILGYIAYLIFKK